MTGECRRLYFYERDRDLFLYISGSETQAMNKVAIAVVAIVNYAINCTSPTKYFPNREMRANVRPSFHLLTNILHSEANRATYWWSFESING
jgi:hypothetical protein